jgi:hypothetical protein
LIFSFNEGSDEASPGEAAFSDFLLFPFSKPGGALSLEVLKI